MGRLSPHGGKRHTFQAPKESSREGQTEGQDGGLITSASYSTCSHILRPEQVNNIPLLLHIISSMHCIVCSEVTLNITTNDTRAMSYCHIQDQTWTNLWIYTAVPGTRSMVLLAKSFRQSRDTRRCQNTLTTISNVCAIFFIQTSWSSVQYFAETFHLKQHWPSDNACLSKTPGSSSMSQHLLSVQSGDRPPDIAFHGATLLAQPTGYWE